MTLRASLRHTMRRVMNTVGYDLIRTDPGQHYQIDTFPGWFTANEARLLYTTIALVRPQRLLEIGTFLGRSTATMALAIRDGGFACEFTSVDFDFADESTFRARFPTVHGRPATMPAEYRLAFDRGLTTSAFARTLLQQSQLDSFVTLASGDFHVVAPGPFHLIMADCLHDHDEITLNAPAIAQLLPAGGVLAVHDSTPANRALLLTFIPTARFIAGEDSLAVYRLD